MQFVYRFVIGGLIVSLFAALGNVLKPRSFCGLFGAAPSVALATLLLTILTDGNSYAATEGRSMIAGAVALCVYAVLCSRLMMRNKIHAARATASALVLWVIVALGAWWTILRRS